MGERKKKLKPHPGLRGEPGRNLDLLGQNEAKQLLVVAAAERKDARHHLKGDNAKPPPVDGAAIVAVLDNLGCTHN